MGYTFFFDEAFHDRKIKLSKSGTLNTMVENALDSYIGVFWGCENEKLSDNISLLTDFENKYRDRFGLNESKELKSETIGKKNFKYGVYSFSKDTYDFYYDLFSLMKEIKPVIQIEIISKTEYLVRDIISKTVFPSNLRHEVNIKSLIYSLTKFINVYHTDELMRTLTSIGDEHSGYRIKKQLLKLLDCVLAETKNIKRKQAEYNALYSMRKILYKSDIYFNSQKEYLFDYTPNFNGLSNLLNELNITPFEVDLVIDQEEKTFITGQNYGFKSIEQEDSKNNVCIRFSDLLSGFIGRMIYAFQNDESMLEDKISKIEDIHNNDLSKKRILSAKWFQVDKRQFDLYLLIFEALIKEHEHYWTTMTTVNGDQAIMLYGLLRYIASYKSFDKFKNIEPNMHSEYCNSSLLAELDNYYKKF